MECILSTVLRFYKFHANVLQFAFKVGPPLEMAHKQLSNINSKSSAYRGVSGTVSIFTQEAVSGN